MTVLTMPPPAAPPSTYPAPAVESCDVCGGSGLVLAERVPSGEERRARVRHLSRLLQCMACAGTGALVMPFPQVALREVNRG
jgi:hypothetical protein